MKQIVKQKKIILKEIISNITFVRKNLRFKCSSNNSSNVLQMFFMTIQIVAPYKSSHRRFSVRKGVLRNFAKFTGKHLCQSLFFNNLFLILKKRLWHMCFPVNFAKFLRTPFLKNTSGRLLQTFACINLYSGIEKQPHNLFRKKILKN